MDCKNELRKFTQASSRLNSKPLKSLHAMPYKEALTAYTPQLSPTFRVQSDEKLLETYHPDSFTEVRVCLDIGANKGDLCQLQVARMLQSDSLVDDSVLNEAHIVDIDVLVLGGGGAGCAAALSAAYEGANVMLATKLGLGDSNTVMAEGGIQAAVAKNDSPQQHFNDILKNARQHVNTELVAKLVLDAPNVIAWLIEQGMNFDVDSMGELCVRRSGGSSSSRVLSCKDYTGLEMMRALKEGVRNSRIGIREYSPVIELLSNASGSCTGAILGSLDRNGFTLVRAKSVILASGGIGRIHINGFPTSNHFGATGDGLVLAYRLGVKLTDLDSFQYHPTGLAHPYNYLGRLITEAIRSSGACLLNACGERFVDELSSRDIVSAAILRECKQGRGIDAGNGVVGVWLDTPGLELKSPGLLERGFPKLIALGEKIGSDPRVSPLLVYPTLHYQNGGVVIDEIGCTTVPGLYCVGELSGGIHGRNRLMGNALLDIISFGRSAGHDAGKRAHSQKFGEISLGHVKKHRQELLDANLSLANKAPVLFPEYVNFDPLSSLGR